MELYADYEYYTDVYGGSAVPESAWKGASRRAVAVLDYVTMSRTKGLDTVPDAVRDACCALTERIFADTQQGNKTAESVGSWSVSYSTQDAARQMKGYFDAARVYLADTGLLYRGTEC